MKKLFLLILAGVLVSGSLLQAAPVSSSRALDIAKMIFAAQPATKAGTGTLKIVWDGEDVATKAVQPAFYVVSRDGGGFVIIAGDDNVQPVLAISDRNEFKVEGMPDNVKSLMEGMKEHVRSAKAQTPEIQAQWARFVATKSDPVAPGTSGLTVVASHPTPEWNQGNSDDYYFHQQVFNTRCPLDADNHWTITGCVAAALSEILTTMSGIYPDAMPTHASGTVQPYTVDDGYVAAATTGHPYTLGTVYDWAGLRTLMNTADINAAITAGKTDLLDNLAQLLADMGAMMHAGYRKDDTYAATGNAPDTLAKYIGFNKSAYWDYASNYTARQWGNKLKAELDRHPVLFSGKRPGGGGHAYVLDGYADYDGSDMYYVNFGWSGADNGYYLLNDFGKYTTQTAAAFDFYPAPESVYAKKITIGGPGLEYMYGDPLEVVPSLGDGGDRFVIQGWLGNGGKETYTGALKLVLKDKTGTVKAESDFTVGINDLPPRYGWSLYHFYLGSDGFGVSYAFGDYVEIYFSTNDAMTEWEPVYVSGNASSVVSLLPVYPAAFIKTADSYSLNDWFEFALKNHEAPYEGTVWTFTDPSGTAVTKNQSEGEFQFTKKGTWKVEAAVAQTVGGDVVETVVTYIKVN